jgi:hypothetical protein
MAADDGAHRGFDPRYDAVFQRGFRGEVHASARPRSSAPSSDAVRPKLASRAKQVEHVTAPAPDAGLVRDSAPTQDVRLTRDARSVRADETDDATIMGGDVDGEAIAPTAPPARLNPYVVALWIIGIGLLAAGAGLEMWAQLRIGAVSFNSVDGVPLDFVLRNVSASIAPPLITVGLATIVGLLFRSAGRSGPGTRT